MGTKGKESGGLKFSRLVMWSWRKMLQWGNVFLVAEELSPEFRVGMRDSSESNDLIPQIHIVRVHTSLCQSNDRTYAHKTSCSGIHQGSRKEYI
jgi:hypothetical protein